MSNAFDNVRLPIDIERGTVGGPSYRTSVITLESGHERRNQIWPVPLNSFNVGYGIQKREDMEAVYAFFNARLGRARGFRFRNWLDFQVRGGPVGIVPDNANQRQLIRVYDDPANPQLRVVTHPEVDTIKVYVNQILTTAYTVKPGGIIEFASDPGNDVLVSFDYDHPVRFDIDRLDITLNTYREGVIPSIQIVETRE
jgi:uncharacterized protein (TIGR02217 family)